ncbi:diacylglycerol kinase (ATP) [Paraburkholderia steynii]|uniref:Diacylglycerol kinase n=1 Tax=Paraburkholderia steynii TaxID=1245441 RepID=A0A7Z7FMX1_9BURK|nr:diacylglycerol kinase [Paraburkholderia steynii]SDJ32435.1 diacylglycerol kinase (ATP) [Paraburkholderia steynii]
MQTRQSNALRAPQESLRDAKAAVSNAEPYGEPFDDVHDMHEDGAPQARARYAGESSSTPVSAMSSTTRDAAQAREDALNGAKADAPESLEPLGPDDPLAPLPFNPYKGNRGITRAWHAMKNSFAGFRVAIREESAFRQELTLAAILLPCGVLVPVEPVSRVLLLGSVFLVLIVELLNSSVEAAIDRISLERHELSRRAKDLGSAAVMVALFICVMTWGLLVGPLVVRWVSGWVRAMQ